MSMSSEVRGVGRADHQPPCPGTRMASYWARPGSSFVHRRAAPSTGWPARAILLEVKTRASTLLVRELDDDEFVTGAFPATATLAGQRCRRPATSRCLGYSTGAHAGPIGPLAAGAHGTQKDFEGRGPDLGWVERLDLHVRRGSGALPGCREPDARGAVTGGSEVNAAPDRGVEGGRAVLGDRHTVLCPHARTHSQRSTWAPENWGEDQGNMPPGSPSRAPRLRLGTTAPTCDGSAATWVPRGPGRDRSSVRSGAPF